MLISFLFLNSCNTMKSSIEHINKLHPVIQQMLNERNLSMKELGHLRCDMEGYESTSVYLPKVGRDMDCFVKKPGGLYGFLDGKLLVIAHDFENAKDSADRYSLKTVLQVLGPPEAILGSVMPIGFAEYVYPSKGIAICGNEPEDYYSSVEVFLPMTLSKYKRFIWNDPAQFGPGPD